MRADLSSPADPGWLELRREGSSTEQSHAISRFGQVRERVQRGHAPKS
jgi:hypothetical protein